MTLQKGVLHGGINNYFFNTKRMIIWHKDFALIWLWVRSFFIFVMDIIYFKGDMPRLGIKELLLCRCNGIIIENNNLPAIFRIKV